MPRVTSQQQQAIAANGDVLVMAGAGAGKTTTLVNRILDRVLHAPQPTSVDRILVVTFNEGAAAEMRLRLRSALEARLRSNPDDTRVAAQLALLETGFVSTLHAFCLRLIRDHFHQLALDPQFAVLDELHAGALRRQALDDILRRHYRGDSPTSPVVRSFLARHAPDDDKALRALLERIHDYARSLAEPHAWLESQHLAHSTPSPDCWRSCFHSEAPVWADGWSDYVHRLADVDPGNFAARECLGAIDELRSGLPDRAHAALASIEHAFDRQRFPRGTIGKWRDPLEKFVSEARTLRALLVPETPEATDPLSEDWSWARSDVLALVQLSIEFDEAFESARRAAGGVDFADLEQLALRLLWDSSTRQPSPLARRWRDRFDFVLVDEYQDINAAQDRIIACVSRTGTEANRFYVGDVKQSIYRFRRADPRIFQDYARRWSDSPTTSVIPLTANFRSHQAILAFVNELFRGLMHSSLGGVDYGPDAELVFGAPDERAPMREQPGGRVELHLLVDDGDVAEEEDADSESAPDIVSEDAQARTVASRLIAWKQAGLAIWDSALARHRPMTWRDVVVLHPAPRPVAEYWTREFAAAGVPFDARRGGFFDAIEVTDLVNLARLLDNPIQDLPLLAVLRSPLVGLDVDELVAIRLAARDVHLWAAATQLARGSPASSTHAATASARTKLRVFLPRFDKWRRIAREGAIAACIETALADTAYEAWLRAQPRAAPRLANLRKLLALSREFDRFQRHGLFRFIRFIEEQEAVSARVENAPAAFDDAVRLLSMHQAKGLEFPVVVVAGLGRKFNTEDLKRDWIVDETFGICPPVVPPGRSRGYQSIPRFFAGQRQRREFIGEQVRLLYVACTRAADRLLLVGAIKASEIERWATRTGSLLTRDIFQASRPLDWLGPSMASLAGRADWAQSDAGSGDRLDWHLERRVPASAEAVAFAGSPAAPAADSATAPATLCGESHEAEPPSELSIAVEPSTVARLQRRLDRRYPQEASTHKPAKTAVTALVRQWRMDTETAETPDLAPYRAGRAPGSETAVARGLAHHLFCELVDLQATATRTGIESEADRMLSEGWLNPAEREALDIDGLWIFWNSQVATGIRSHAESVHRELPFTARRSTRHDTSADGLSGAPGDLALQEDFQVVQGVVDLAVVLDDQIWIVDFKTDHVAEGDLPGKTAAYGFQLQLYADALSEIFGRPVSRLWLYFVTPRQLVQVEARSTPGREKLDRGK